MLKISANVAHSPANRPESPIKLLAVGELVIDRPNSQAPRALLLLSRDALFSIKTTWPRAAAMGARTRQFLLKPYDPSRHCAEAPAGAVEQFSGLGTVWSSLFWYVPLSMQEG